MQQRPENPSTSSNGPPFQGYLHADVGTHGGIEKDELTAGRFRPGSMRCQTDVTLAEPARHRLAVESDPVVDDIQNTPVGGDSERD